MLLTSPQTPQLSSSLCPGSASGPSLILQPPPPQMESQAPTGHTPAMQPFSPLDSCFPNMPGALFCLHTFAVPSLLYKVFPSTLPGIDLAFMDISPHKARASWGASGGSLAAAGPGTHAGSCASRSRNPAGRLESCGTWGSHLSSVHFKLPHP